MPERFVGVGHRRLPVPGLFTAEGWRTVRGAVEVIQLVGEFMEYHVVAAVPIPGGFLTLFPGQNHLTPA